MSPSDWLTALVPNLKGNFVPFNTRWYSALAPHDRVWVPSLYFGVCGIALFLTQLFQSGDRSSRRLRLVFFIALFSALGSNGLGSLLNAIQGLISNDQIAAMLPGEVGGLQWIWVKLLPFYAEFRYPAKWLPFVMLPACSDAFLRVRSASVEVWDCTSPLADVRFTLRQENRDELIHAGVREQQVGAVGHQRRRRHDRVRL